MMHADSGSTEDFVPDDSPPGLRRTVGIAALSLGSFLLGAMLTVVIPILPNIAAEMSGGGAATFSTQVLIAMPMLGIVIGGLVSTMLFARFPARTVFLGALVLYGLVGALGAVASLPVLIGSRLAMGAIAACLGAASTALVGERVQPDKRSRILGFAMAGASLLSIGAMLTSGRVADLAGWRMSFLVFPVLAAAMFALVATCTDPSRAAPRTATHRAGSRWAAILALWPVFLFVIAVNFTAFTTNSQASFVLADDGITSSAGRAQVMSVNQIFVVLAAVSFPFVSGRLGMRFMPALILAIMGTGLVLLGNTSGVGNAMLALAVLGAGNGLLFPYQGALVLQRAPAAVRGQAAGLLVSCHFLADAINPIVLGPMIIAIGLRETIAMVGLVALAGCLCALVVGVRYLGRAPGAAAHASPG